MHVFSQPSSLVILFIFNDLRDSGYLRVEYFVFVFRSLTTEIFLYLQTPYKIKNFKHDVSAYFENLLIKSKIFYFEVLREESN